MKVPGYVLAVIGLVIAVAGAIDHFSKLPVIGSISKGSLIFGVIGVVVLVIGAVMAMSGGKAAA